jgi:bifunctional non-homologous end joining protein LigD
MPKTSQRRPPASLQSYEAKRAFALTPEPPPIATFDRTGPLLFVVQQHAATRLHYDFRLELDGVLKSWAVPKGPVLDPREKRLAVATEDHPFEYASFEGVIPKKQYGAGEVIVWDCGVYSPDSGGEHAFHDRARAMRRAREELSNGKLNFFLRGEKLKGSFALVRTKEANSWLLIKHKDRFAQPAALDSAQSVLSGIRVEDLKRLPSPPRIAAERLAPHGPSEDLPSKLAPMLAMLADAPFTDSDWLFEPKMDGYRAIIIIEKGKVRLQSRRGLDLSAMFPRIVHELEAQAVEAMILDGELIAFHSGKPSFNALQNRAQLKTPREIDAAERENPCVLYCFDLLHFAGVNLRHAAYSDRRRYLAQCLLPSSHVQLVPAVTDGTALYRAALQAGFEGIVAKKKSSSYESGARSRFWLKVKATQTADFVIGGYSQGKGSRADRFGALLVGTWEKRGKLKYAGHVGTGFDDKLLAALKQRFEPLKARTHPFTEKPQMNARTTWLKPVLVAEIKFAEWTPDGHLRSPVFSWLREDIDPKEVRAQRAVRMSPGSAPKRQSSEIESVLQQLADPKESLQLTVQGERISLTNLNKVLWPEDKTLNQPALTKRDLLRYLVRVSPHMLPHLADRPLTMIRMPDGIQGERFFQKHWGWASPSFVEKITVFSDSKSENHEYLVCNNLATLLWLGQAGTLEFHVWHSRANPEPEARGASTNYAGSIENMESSILNFPDYLVFDIDPYIYSGREARGAEPELNSPAFEKAKQVAFWLKQILDSMALRSIVKTSGKTGLHVFVPIKRTLDFASTRGACETIGRHLLRQHPHDITMEWSVKKRTGKIFMDYNMNVRSKTLNVAYSPRGVPGAPVSMPLTWEELAAAHPLQFRMWNIFERMENQGDVWQDALTEKADLRAALG